MLHWLRLTERLNPIILLSAPTTSLTANANRLQAMSVMIEFSKGVPVKVLEKPFDSGSSSPTGDFERIDLDIEIREDAFYLTPLAFKYAHESRKKIIERTERPLSFTHDYISRFWMRQLNYVQKKVPGIVSWALDEICRIVQVHRSATKLPHIQEPDILRASGPLKHLGIQLGGYVGKGYDCLTDFAFMDYPVYTIPVEIKRNSAGFVYQQKKYGKEELSRAVVLCAIHDHKQLSPHIDVIELDALCQYVKKI